MALVTEDGTGKVNAESYCDVAFATTHHTNRGKSDDWGAVDDQEVALRRATDYIEQTYRGKWSGARWTNEQALDWPRVDVAWPDSPQGFRPYNVIPVELKRACAELALRTAAGDLLADLGRETTEETVDVITVKYAEGKSRQTQFAAVDGLLRSLMKGGGGFSIPMVRS